MRNNYVNIFKPIWYCIALIIAFVVIRYFYKQYQNKHGKQKIEKATIVSKRIDRPIHYNDAMKEKAYIHYLVTYNINNKEIELEVEEDYYEHANIGDHVELTYRGNVVVK